MVTDHAGAYHHGQVFLAGRPGLDCPTTIATVNGLLLIVCSQVRAMHAKTAPRLPFEIATTDLPNWQ